MLAHALRHVSNNVLYLPLIKKEKDAELANLQVWRAQCKSLGSDVAIKIVNLERAGRSMVALSANDPD